MQLLPRWGMLVWYLNSLQITVNEPAPDTDGPSLSRTNPLHRAAVYYGKETRLISAPP